MIKNLITNKDIKALLKKDNLTVDELALIQQKDWKEYKLQSACNLTFMSKFNNMSGSLYFFQQNDNGGSGSVVMKKLKKAQGTISGWPDVTLWKFDTEKKSIFVEFKRPGKIDFSPNQIEIHKKLREYGEIVEVCNNTVYFDKVICQKFEDL